MTMFPPWWAWAILSLLLGLSEIHKPGAYLIWISLGAAATAAIDFGVELSFAGQIGTFAVASAISCAGGYFIYNRFSQPVERAENLNRRDLEMIGQQGIAFGAFANGHGKVRVGDTVWLAEGPDMEDGTPVVIRAMHGTSASVEPLPKNGKNDAAAEG